tara:strand:- start:209 stop:829 length:621 start_codon:yes stop_codon:yes gene_type:complete
MELWVSKFEDYVNKILLLDEETCNALKKINKKIIAFEFINTKIKLYITFVGDGLSIKTKCNSNPDVVIKSSPGNFIRKILFPKNQSSAHPFDMQIEGDITLARDFEEIISNLNIDFEDPLSRLLGNTLAFQISRFIRVARKSTFLAAETILLDISEYLRFEIEMLPDELLMSEFCKEVDFLRDETELTSKRIDRLSFALSENRHNS